MKIALVNHNLGSGGAEKLICDMAIEMKNKNLDVDIILLTSVNGVYENLLKENKINVIHLSDKWDIYNPKNIFKLTKVLKKYDVVHTHIYAAQLWTAFASYLLPKKIKYFTTEHNTTNRRREKSIFKILDKWMYSRYNKIVSITSEVQKELQGWIGKNKNTEIVIENGIRLNDFIEAKAYNRKDFNLKKEEKILIMVSRFSPQKDHRTLIEAMSYLDSEYKLLLVGEGELREQCINQVKELEIENRVSFLGYRKDIPNLLKMSDIAVLSSYYEGLPISALEIMASGTPFVASKVSGLEKLVDGSGVLFKQGDSKTLASILKDLSGNKKYRDKVIDACMKKSENFCIKKITKKYINTYSLEGKR